MNPITLQEFLENKEIEIKLYQEWVEDLQIENQKLHQKLRNLENIANTI